MYSVFFFFSLFLKTGISLVVFIEKMTKEIKKGRKAHSHCIKQWRDKNH
jgi:hypothetical protein